MINHRDNLWSIVALLLVVLFCGSTNLFCVTVDTDNDDDTPPVTIELGVLASSRKASASHPSTARQDRIAAVPSTAAPNFVGKSAERQLESGRIQLSASFNVPLRC